MQFPNRKLLHIDSIFLHNLIFLSAQVFSYKCFYRYRRIYHSSVRLAFCVRLFLFFDNFIEVTQWYWAHYPKRRKNNEIL